jgi:hypothetical protein
MNRDGFPKCPFKRASIQEGKKILLMGIELYGKILTR